MRHVRNYRGFVFAKMNDAGSTSKSSSAKASSSFDNMVDRSPAGRLEVAGGVLRYMHNCNWKMLVENQTDTCHPMVAHESSAGTAIEVWKKAPPGSQEADGGRDLRAVHGAVRVLREHGHPRLAERPRPHRRAPLDPFRLLGGARLFRTRWSAAYGEERAKAILDENRHNTVYFPNLMIKGPIQLLRLFKPIAADKTLVESWTFRLVDAPDMLLERTLMYNRLINAPTSVVGHDDLEMYERAQEGLHVDANQWVNMQRLYDPAERQTSPR